MGNKLFNKSLPKRCEYCANSKTYTNDETLLCKYHGVVNAFDKCRKYKYDILKRIPKEKKLGDDYSPEDFSI